MESKHKQITVEQLVAWVNQENRLIEEKLERETDLVIKAALANYKENLWFFLSDIERLAKCIVQEQLREVEPNE